jgi:hypothetical protein
MKSRPSDSDESIRLLGRRARRSTGGNSRLNGDRMEHNFGVLVGDRTAFPWRIPGYSMTHFLSVMTKTYRRLVQLLRRVDRHCAFVTSASRLGEDLAGGVKILVTGGVAQQVKRSIGCACIRWAEAGGRPFGLIRASH